MKISTSQSPVPEDPKDNPKDNAAQPAENRQRPLPYEDDHVARVRAARAAAEREMKKFGHPSEYVITRMQGRRTDLRYDDDDSPGLPENTETKLAGDDSGNKEE